MGRIPKGTTLTGKHLMAMTMLAKGIHAKDVAKSMGVTVDSIYVWQKWPQFIEAQTRYVASVAREELDRGLADATINLHEHSQEIVNWMAGVVLGSIELKQQDQRRWKMALEFLHHAGIIDKQAMLNAQAPAQNQTNVNLNLDQRRQAVLATGNAELSQQLEKFRPPSQP